MTSTNRSNSQLRELIAHRIWNGYAETEVGYHAEYRMWGDEWVKGCYAQIAAPYDGTVRVYAPSWKELAKEVEEYFLRINQ